MIGARTTSITPSVTIWLGRSGAFDRDHADLRVIAGVLNLGRGSGVVTLPVWVKKLLISTIGSRSGEQGVSIPLRQGLLA